MILSFSLRFPETKDLSHECEANKYKCCYSNVAAIYVKGHLQTLSNLDPRLSLRQRRGSLGFRLDIIMVQYYYGIKLVNLH